MIPNPVYPAYATDDLPSGSVAYVVTSVQAPNFEGTRSCFTDAEYSAAGDYGEVATGSSGAFFALMGGVNQGGLPMVWNAQGRQDWSNSPGTFGTNHGMGYIAAGSSIERNDYDDANSFVDGITPSLFAGMHD